MIYKILKLIFGERKIKTGKTIKYNEIDNLFPYRSNNVIYLKNPNVTTTDLKYNLINKNSLEEWLKTDFTSWRLYQKEKMDCDDFAFILLGRVREKVKRAAFGWACSDTHAFNIFIDENKKLWIIEPQTDRIFQSKAAKYKIKKVLI